MPKYVFVTGGVVSSLGKGIAAASLAVLLQSKGYRVGLRKLDPYLNVDPGTMSPYQHGEVFITDDGAETDMDLGHYERFTNISCRGIDNVTSGQIYEKLLYKERKGEYLGGTVQVIPHVTNLIKEFILTGSQDIDFLICEIGGTVGDIEALPYLEAARQIGYELGAANVIYIHLTLVPYIATSMELKTKPTQHSVKELRAIGIQPNIILCRADRPIPESALKKIGAFCNVPEDFVIQALDQKVIYHIPVAYNKEGLDTQLLKYFNLQELQKSDFTKWHNLIQKIENPKRFVKVAIVAKYLKFHDAYKSLVEALIHAGAYNDCQISIVWVDAGISEKNSIKNLLQDVNGIIVPGGFGERGVEDKILAIQYARENDIPYLGICLGMQLALIEFARNRLNIKDANSEEFVPSGVNNVIIQEEDRVINSEIKLGGTMRLGSLECVLQENSLIHKIYQQNNIYERHRHRFNFNMMYKKQFNDAGVNFTGLSADSKFAEVVELSSNRWFIGVQFHPEFKSRPFTSHPIFISFTQAMMQS